MNDRTTHRRRIQPGQTELRRLARGSRITALAGTLRIEAPAQWLAETMLRAVSTLCPGLPFIVQRTAIHDFDASSAATSVHLIPMASARSGSSGSSKG